MTVPETEGPDHAGGPLLLTLAHSPASLGLLGLEESDSAPKPPASPGFVAPSGRPASPPGASFPGKATAGTDPSDDSLTVVQGGPRASLSERELLGHPGQARRDVRVVLAHVEEEVRSVHFRAHAAVRDAC